MIRVLVVVEVPFYREGLAQLLNKNEDIRVVGTAGVASASVLTARDCADVVLIDVGLPDAAGAIERMRTLPSPPKFLALAMNETPDNVLRWAELGVAAYVPRSATPEDLLRVLRGVAQEEFYCTPQIAAHLLHHVAVLATASRHSEDAFRELSPRELEVLSLIARGLPNKVIASTLSISHATAKNHVHKILEKLRLHRRGEVASLLHSNSERRSA